MAPATKYRGRLANLAWFLVGGAVGMTLLLSGPALLRTGSSAPPVNFVAITHLLATSGQPSRAQLMELGEQGYEIVINLAPPTSLGSIGDEGALVSRGGATYVNIPVDWNMPRESDFELFSALLKANRQRKILVHCQINRRASVFSFLYRVIYGGVPAEDALEAVHAIWLPSDDWSDLIRETLSRHGIEFEP